MALIPRIHGGPSGAGVAQFDFSTNSNACGPSPKVLAAVQQADATRYPDPSYTALRASLAALHGVDVARILVAGSASEFIFRFTAWVAQVAQRGPKRAGRSVCVPLHAYGDYAQAAQAWGLAVSHDSAKAQLVWCCEPSSPLGGAHAHWPHWFVPAPVCAERAGGDAETVSHSPVVLDCAYAPLRLSGLPSLTDGQLSNVWQLFTPNKALGLTGVRAAYAIAPVGAVDGAAGDLHALDALAPSWPVGAHGVAMLNAWVQNDTQTWLAESLHTLRRWKARQTDLLQDLGWTVLPSDTNFFCARPGDSGDLQALLTRLRASGIQLRDTTSFNLPGHVRLSVQAPVAQDALRSAL